LRRDKDLPPLDPEDVDRVVSRIAGLPAAVVGGQAVNFWARRYINEEPHLREHGPFTSKDIDFQAEHRGTIEECAARLGATADFSVAKPFGSVLEAEIIFRDGNGQARIIDFVRKSLALKGERPLERRSRSTSTARKSASCILSCVS
jgi:hypothetical protein